jgi:AbrB family looped-hinge helix DNA binding protein
MVRRSIPKTRTPAGLPKFDSHGQAAMLPLESRIIQLSENKPMPTLIKIYKKGQITLPTRLRSQAGIGDGDLVDATFSRGKIILTPKVVIDRSKFPTADDEYTPEQRRIIDAGIAKGLEDFRKGRFHGPFASAKEASAYIERVATKRVTAKTS